MGRQWSQLNKRKLDYDCWRGIQSQCRTNVGMDQRICCWCTLYQMDTRMKRHILDGIVVACQCNLARMSIQLARNYHGNYCSVRMEMVSMGMHCFWLVVELEFHGIGRTDFQSVRLGMCKSEHDLIHDTQPRVHKFLCMDQRICIERMTIDHHNLRWVHILGDSHGPDHMDCHQNQVNNNKHQLRFVRGIRHLFRMAMDCMALHLVHVVQLF